MSTVEMKKYDTFSWKEAMLALVNNKKVEARVCIPGIPESENKWFDVEFGVYPDNAEKGWQIELGQNWDYRLKLTDRKERERILNECERLKIFDMDKLKSFSTQYLRDILNTISLIARKED